jgi:glycosyltransferase involved in cell wall biosynthesis
MARQAHTRVSVVLAARNEKLSIGRSIQSILAQTLRDWELIVVDDGSNDATADVAESYGDPRIRVVRQERRGLPVSLNHGISLAVAPLIARQDADDASLPERLERQVDFLDRRPEVAVVGSLWFEVDGKGQPLTPRAKLVAGRLNEALTRFNPITHTTATFRKSVFAGVGGYDERFGYASDYDLWLRIAHAGETLWNLEDVLAVRVMGGGNMSLHSERAQIVEELVIRWADLQRRRRRGASPLPQACHLAFRSAVLLAPLPLRRAVRRRRRKAP